MKETNLRWLADPPSPALRYVRQICEWNESYLPVVRALKDAEILGFTFGKGDNGERVVGRIFYLLANRDDGLVPIPADDPYGGLPVVPTSLAAGQDPMPYRFDAEALIDAERRRRSATVSYWRLRAKLDAPRRPLTKMDRIKRWLRGKLR